MWKKCRYLILILARDKSLADLAAAVCPKVEVALSSASSKYVISNNRLA